MNKHKANKIMLWFNGFFAVFWLIMIPIAVKTGLKESVPFLVFISLWALFGAHLAAFIAGLPSE
jgi:hypothetical protein